MKMIIVDPPSGWLYGFPKQFDFEFNGDPCDRERALKDWFVDSGYPRKDVELAMQYSRYWDSK